MTSSAGDASVVCLRCGVNHVTPWCPRCGARSDAGGRLLSLAAPVLAGGVIVVLGIALHPFALSWYRGGSHGSGIVSTVADGVTGAFVGALPYVYAAMAGGLVARIPRGIDWRGRVAVGLCLALLSAPLAALGAWRGYDVAWGPACGLAMLGALLGAPLIGMAAERAPARWFARGFSGLHWSLRLLILVPVLSVGMVVGATVVILLLMAWCTLAMIIGMLQAFLGGSRSTPAEEEERERVVFSMQQGTRLADGQIVREGFWSNKPTGVKINAEGQIVQEGFWSDKPTGVKINEQGQVVQEGFWSDRPTGAKINEQGQIVQEGFWTDRPTGFAIDRDGRAVKEGFWSDKPAGFEVTADGRVRGHKKEES